MKHNGRTKLGNFHCSGYNVYFNGDDKKKKRRQQKKKKKK